MVLTLSCVLRLLGILYIVPNQVTSIDSAVGAAGAVQEAVSSPSGVVAAIGGITQGITGGIRRSRVSYCFTTSPCTSICPSRGQGVLSGTYCFLGRCFCQKGNVVRQRSCRTPSQSLVKACTLPPGINMIGKPTTPIDPDASMLPEFDVCKARGRSRGRSYCVFYTDFKTDIAGGIEPPGSISQVAVPGNIIPTPNKTKRPRRKKKRKHRRRNPKRSPRFTNRTTSVDVFSANKVFGVGSSCI